MFHGNGSEDPQQHWFLCEAVWRVKQVTDANMKANQMVTTFRDRALNWFMKFSGGQPKILNEIQMTLIVEFKKPKSESQCIIELKEIKQMNGESTWDFDQRFKVLMGQVSFEISDAQHKEWFIAALLPHIRVPLTQQRITSQEEALEISMKLEASPIGETGVGMAQIHNQLANLNI